MDSQSKTVRFSPELERRQTICQTPEIEDATIWTNPKMSRSAKVIDESLAGMAALIDGDGDGIEVGHQVLVDHASTRRLAQVVGITIHDTGKLRLSLYWDDPAI